MSFAYELELLEALFKYILLSFNISYLRASSTDYILNMLVHSFMQRPEIWTGRNVGGRVKNEGAKKVLQNHRCC